MTLGIFCCFVGQIVWSIKIIQHNGPISLYSVRRRSQVKPLIRIWNHYKHPRFILRGLPMDIFVYREQRDCVITGLDLINIRIYTYYMYICNTNLAIMVLADVRSSNGVSPSLSRVPALQLETSFLPMFLWLSLIPYEFCWPHDVNRNGWRDFTKSRGTSSVNLPPNTRKGAKYPRALCPLYSYHVLKVLPFRLSLRNSS